MKQNTPSADYNKLWNYLDNGNTVKCFIGRESFNLVPEANDKPSKKNFIRSCKQNKLTFIPPKENIDIRFLSDKERDKVSYPWTINV